VTSVRSALLGAAAIRKDGIRMAPAVLTGTVAGSLTLLAIALDDYPATLPLVIGAAFVGIANLNGAADVRVRTMLWTLLWITLSTLLGGTVATWNVVEIAVVGVVGLAGGFAGALGARALVTGVLAMVVYTVFSGTAMTFPDAIRAAALMALGGGVMFVVALVAILQRSGRAAFQRSETRTSFMTRLRDHRHRDDVFFHHAVRLALALMAGTALANLLAWPHEYWIPMTIVWMTRPDSDGTVSRVTERILGTFVGIALSLLLIEVVSNSPIAIAIYTILGTVLLLAFLQANYPIAVSGISLIIVALFSLLGEPVLDTIAYRATATVIAGVITIAAAFLLWRMADRST